MKYKKLYTVIITTVICIGVYLSWFASGYHSQTIEEYRSLRKLDIVLPWNATLLYKDYDYSWTDGMCMCVFDLSEVNLDAYCKRSFFSSWSVAPIPDYIKKDVSSLLDAYTSNANLRLPLSESNEFKMPVDLTKGYYVIEARDHCYVNQLSEQEYHANLQGPTGAIIALSNTRKLAVGVLDQETKRLYLYHQEL